MFLGAKVSLKVLSSHASKACVAMEDEEPQILTSWAAMALEETDWNGNGFHFFFYQKYLHSLISL